MYEGNVDFAEGRWIRENDHTGCVIGHVVANDYFDDTVHAGDRIEINGHKFVVIGVFEKGNALTSGDVDNYIYMTARASQDVLGTDEISMIYVKIDDIDDAEKIADKIEEVVDNNHKLDDFTNAMTMGSFIDQIGGIFKVIQVVLVGIAAISLIVASIGIMNTMMMAVMERTHEVGVMKAIGARNKDILTLFLIKAGVVSLVGSVLGSLMAISAGIIATNYAGLDVPAPITPWLLALALMVALVVGIASGLYPAMKAARYE